ncbi:MAG: hypothetical protein RI897_103 [Verrucomicrobiota bacterium]
MDLELLTVAGDHVCVVGAVDESQAVAGAEAFCLEAGHDVVFIVAAGGDEEVGISDLFLLELLDGGGVALDDDCSLEVFREVAAEAGVAFDDTDAVAAAFEHLGEGEAVFTASKDDHAGFLFGQAFRAEAGNDFGERFG